jgi:6-pyruvoyltetrahydropterin/6-carboxytetrahydropterin synthase
MLTLTRRIEWDAMHRIPRHESKCRAFHGHRYVAEITCHADALDELGRIIDFGVVKERVGGWVDQHWDHTAVLMRGDPEAAAITEVNARMGRPVYLLDGPPTAEVMVAHLAGVAQALLADTGVRVVRIRLWETPNGSAEWAAPADGPG